MCSNCGSGVNISEGIIDYGFNVMLLVQCYGRDMFRLWGEV